MYFYRSSKKRNRIRRSRAHSNEFIKRVIDDVDKKFARLCNTNVCNSCNRNNVEKCKKRNKELLLKKLVEYNNSVERYAEVTNGKNNS